MRPSWELENNSYHLKIVSSVEKTLHPRGAGWGEKTYFAEKRIKWDYIH